MTIEEAISDGARAALEFLDEARAGGADLSEANLAGIMEALSEDCSHVIDHLLDWAPEDPACMRAAARRMAAAACLAYALTPGVQAEPKRATC